MHSNRKPRTVALGAAAASVAVLASACATASGETSGAGGKTIDLVAYSTPQVAYADLIPQFTATSAGKGVSVKQSYGPSGSQSRAVIAGQRADVAEFSLEPDMTKLVDEGLVAPDWNSGEHHGIVTDSVVVLVVRKGNPKHITGWDDLVKPGIEVVTPNVFSSGSAKWNLMAAYGAQIKLGKSPAEALGFVRTMLQNTVSQPESGSKATETFVGGTGDVLISYENEAIKAQQAGEDVDFVTPDQTILIENPIAVTEDAPAVATDFVDFLYTDEAQKTFADNGYRPVVAADLDPSRFPTPKTLFTIEDLGGWSKVNTEFFDPDNGSISKIENDLGVSGG